MLVPEGAITGATPLASFSAQEQYFLELVNRARMNPYGEEKRLGYNASEITSATKGVQVLAPNSFLNNSATSHSQHMLDVDKFAHSGIGDGTPHSRMGAAGYAFTGAWASGENIAWNSINSIDAHHKQFFTSESGHRQSMLYANFKEVGIGSVVGTYDGWAGSLMSTQNFAVAGSSVFVTGVGYTDDVKSDDFYSIGEGEGGWTAKLLQNGSSKVTTTNWSAGGYALKTTVSGAVEIVFTNTSSTTERGATFKLGTQNVKIDIVDGNTIDANVSLTLTRGSSHAHLLGIGSISATGNSKANKLYGNDASNSLSGKDGNDALSGRGGNDALYGGKGDDTLSGGAGSDKFKYLSASEGGDHLSYFSGADSFVFEGSAFGLGDFSGTLASSRFRSNSSGAAGDSGDRFIYRTTNDTLWYDSNGSVAGGTKVMIADLSNDFALTASDILIV
jgi:serralysin